ncbi:hypothetical protein [Xenorhabdus siamensis]|uniref:hypothetical protein n=1 Tax=Xenorhabdus siamensis TaxID=3136254 RepID=UPI0030F38865
MLQLSFDASTLEIWAPQRWCAGGIDHTTNLLTSSGVVRALQTYRITVLWFPGNFNRLAVVISPVLPQIKGLSFLAAISPFAVINSTLKHCPPQQLLNAYGPTEGTTFTTTYPIEALEEGRTRSPLAGLLPIRGFICWIIMVSQYRWGQSVKFILGEWGVAVVI